MPSFPVHHQLQEFTQTHVLSQWCHPIISSSVIPFSSCLQSFPAIGSLQMSQHFTSGGQSIGVSASTSAFLVNIQDWFPLGWSGWISLQSKGLSILFSNITVFSNELALWIRWPKYWSFSFSISPSIEYSGLIFFRMDWFDLLAVWGLSRVFSNITVQKHQFFRV